MKSFHLSMGRIVYVSVISVEPSLLGHMKGKYNMDKQIILNRLDVKTFYTSEVPSVKWNSKDEGIGLCPFHEDNKESLSINYRTGLFFCHACNEKGDIFSFYQKKHGVDFKAALYELAKQTGITEPTKKPVIVDTYDYIDESGDLLFQTVRYEPKDFNQRRPDGKGGWIYNLKDIRLVPYNLSEVLKAKSVIVVEGEKDCDNLKSLGLTATCNPMGAGKWKPSYNEYFKGKRVAIIPDNDKPGLDHALQIVKNLRGIGESVRLVELPDLPEKGDITDWITQGGNKEKLVELIKSTPEWIPENKRQYFIRIGDILHEETELSNEIIRDFLPDGSLCLLTAPSTHYKTWLALYIAKCVDENIPCLGRDTKYRKVYYVDKENPKSVVKAYCKKLGINENTNIELWPLWAEKEPPPFPDEVYLEIAKEKPLIIFDSQIRFYPKGTDENSASDMNPFMGFLKRLTRTGATVLILHHAGKSESSEYRGSSDILGGVDIAYTIKKSEDDPPILTLKCIKSRFYQERDITVKVFADDIGFMFEVVQNPDIEILEAIHELLAEKDELNTNQIYELVKKELDIKSKFQVLKFLKKGEGKFWDIEKRGRAIFYQSKSPAIYSKDYKTDKKEQSKKEKTDTHSETLQSLDNTIKSYSPDSIQTIETNEVIDLEHEEVEIIE